MRRNGNRSAEKLKSEIAGAERIRRRRSEVRSQTSEVLDQCAFKRISSFSEISDLKGLRKRQNTNEHRNNN